MEIGRFYKFLFLLSVATCVVFILIYRSPCESSDDDLPFLTIHANEGRLGNQMFTYATLFGLTTMNHRRMRIRKTTSDLLNQYFDISTPVVEEGTFVEANPWKIGNWLSERDRCIPRSSNIVKGNAFPTSYTFFDHIRSEIREVFRFKPEYQQHAQSVLWKVKHTRPQTQVFVGIHVRRGDYLRHSEGGWLRDFEGREVDMEFFEEATRYFNSKYQNVTFLTVSDDREWCRKNLSRLGILTAPDSPSAGHDLALLSQCNHTIMTYGTYGFWGGYLAGGEVVYFTDFLNPNSMFTKKYFVYRKMYPPEWIGISTTKPGFWKSYTNSFLT